MTIDNRMELLFLYETKDCNPNGDPLDENRPRTDPDTGHALVTDVRIKRTIRDYLFHVKGEEILVRDTFDGEGLNDGKGRAEMFYEDAGIEKDDKIRAAVTKLQTTVLEQCIDARLFGTTLPVSHGKTDGSLKVTGPVQFSGFSRSLHQVDPQFVQGTAGFASKKGSMQKSFREDFVLPYACIATYGIVNEIAAKTSELAEEDVDHLLEGLWRGTESLISRSKMGHKPLFLMRLRHAQQRQIGDLAGQLSLESDKPGTELRAIEDYEIDASTLIDSMERVNGGLLSIDVHQDPRLTFRANGTTGTFAEVAGDTFDINEIEALG